MKLRLLLPVVAAATLAACSDVAPTESSFLGPLFALKSNPPPPALSGSALGTFTTAPTTSSIASLAIGETSLSGSFRFWVDGTELNATQALDSYWINLPDQTLPPQAGAIGAISRARVVWENGMTIGSGRAFAFDSRNKTFVVIDFSQINASGNLFGDCFKTGRDCVTILAGVTAQLYRIIGTDEGGNYIFDVKSSNPAQISWVPPGW